MKGNKNLLDINFKNSLLLEVNKMGKDIEFVIDIDTYMFPGKPFGIIRFKGVMENIPEINTKLDDLHINFIRIERLFNESRKQDIQVVLELKDGVSEELKFYCQNFWMDRVENYKQFKHIFL